MVTRTIPKKRSKSAAVSPVIPVSIGSDDHPDNNNSMLDLLSHAHATLDLLFMTVCEGNEDSLSAQTLASALQGTMRNVERAIEVVNGDMGPRAFADRARRIIGEMAPAVSP